ncbi:MAG: GDP-mannose 4,6-dehydratase, partial [Candidatus Binatia bacterium]
LVRRPDSRRHLAALASAHPGWPGEALHVADVEDAAAIDATIAALRPDVLFHLAGVTFVPDTVAAPAAALRVNALGAVHVFAAVQRHRPDCRVLAVGSGDAYGAIEPGELPVRETTPLRPLSPYGASKAALDLIADQWARGAGLDIVRVRPFNHTGPGQRPDFVCPDFARQIAAVARGEQAPVLAVGDLDLVRDFSDVRDVVAAYLAVCERGVRGEVYNVCSGVGRSIRSILDALSAMAGVTVRTDSRPERMRQHPVPVIVGNADKLHAATGWTPRIAWADTLAAVLADWR